MPNRAQRRASDPTLDKWLHVEDDDGNPYDIFFRDVSAKDEFDFSQQVPDSGGLCDMFLNGKVTLTGIAGLIWSQRRKFEKRLTVRDVMKLVSMATLETMELHDPEDEGETAIEDMAPDDPRRKLAEMARGRRSDTERGLPGFGEPTSSSGHDSGPSTD